jgi:hypothetical protein
LQIVHGEKSFLVNTCYQHSLENINAPGWTGSLRELLLSCGLGEAWYNQGVGDVYKFIVVLKERLIDMYKQEWHDRLSNSSKARFYLAIKFTHSISTYLQTDRHSKIAQGGPHKTACQLTQSRNINRPME